MGTPKIIKMDNGSGYARKTFQQFCNFEIANIRQVFKDKEFWNMPWLLENITSKNKNRTIISSNTT